MAPRDEDAHVFIVRVWREPREIAGAQPEWRGVVEHVASKQRRFIREPSDISTFVAGYVDSALGDSQLKRWLSRWRKRFTP